MTANPPPPLVVAIDASALRDGRASAGIGRYVTGLLEAVGQAAGVRVVSCIPSAPPRLDAWAVRFLNAQPAQAGARFRRRAPRARVFHATSTDPSLVWPLSAQVVTIHDVAAWSTPSTARGVRHRLTAAYFAWQRGRFRRCGAVIAVSDSTADEACEVLGLNRASIHVIGEGVATVFSPQGASQEHDAGLRSVVGIDAPGYIAWVGSLRVHDPRKALDFLIEGVAGVEPKPPLVLVGQRGDEAARVEKLAQSKGITVITTGYVNDITLAAIYRGAGAVAIASRHEGFGLPMLEAMACGAPVVATAVANLVHLGRDEAAVLVPSNDTTAFTDALRQVLSNGALTARLRAGGPTRAAEHGWAEMGRRTVAVYREVAARRSR